MRWRGTDHVGILEAEDAMPGHMEDRPQCAQRGTLLKCHTPGFLGKDLRQSTVGLSAWGERWATEHLGQSPSAKPQEPATAPPSSLFEGRDWDFTVPR